MLGKALGRSFKGKSKKIERKDKIPKIIFIEKKSA